MSRPPTDSPTNDSVAGVESLLEQLQQAEQLSEEPSSGSQAQRHRMSKDSEGYPSWLPKRPLHPAPASTVHGSVSEGPFVGGRKPTPRSMRVVSYAQDASQDRREPTDQTKVNIPPPRVWSRGAGAPVVFAGPEPRPPQPRFHATGLHLELLRNPGLKSRLYFYLFPLLVLAHIPLQTFFDLNAVFILVQISKFPNPLAPGVPGSGKNWALGAAAYVACWLVWIFPVVIMYELVFSFARRWRIKRPVMLPLYLSSSGFNFVSMTSFTNFCFMQHLRRSAFSGEEGSWRDGMAETFSFYSQNLPTVALLLPRAGLSLALLLAFSNPDPGVIALADAGRNHRDKTFFRVHDGTLTSYARGILYANAAWALWRALVVLVSWIGLWVLSGTGCAGICGPQNRWDEETMEKIMSVYSDNVSDLESLPWKWRESTAIRVQTAFEFCLTIKQRWSRREKAKKDVNETSELLAEPLTPAFEGMDRVLAAAGFPSAPPPARRGVLSGDLFDSPVEPSPEFGDIIPKVVKRSSKEREREGPLMKLPYPFTGPGAQMSSQDRVPFPPSPRPSAEKRTTSGSGSGSPEGEEDDDDDDDDEDEDDDDMEGYPVGSEEPSSGRASGSMSSLGHPVTSRYPFQFRRPARGASNSSHTHTHSHSQSTGPQRSILSQSTGNVESTDSHPARSQHSASASSSSAPDAGRSQSASSASNGIPMPPRHPQAQQAQRARGRGRSRAGTVPMPSASASASSSSISMPPPTPVDFPRRPRASTGSRAATTSGSASGSQQPHPQLGVGPNESFGDVESEEGSNEDDGEGEDQLGLLTGSASPSPRTSLSALRQRASNISLSLAVQPRRTSRYSSSHSGSGSHSRTNSQTNSHSGSSSARSRADSMNAVRERAQSLLQTLGVGSSPSLGASSFEGMAMRIRANSSMARLEEDSGSEHGRSRSGSVANTHSRSGSGSDGLMSSGAENNTFGHPIRAQTGVAHLAPSPVPEASSEHSDAGSHYAEAQERLQPSPSRTSVFSTPSVATQQAPRSEQTISRPPSVGQLAPEPRGVPIPIIRTTQDDDVVSSSSYADLSSAPQSFVTAPVTIEGATTDSSGRTVGSWEGTHMVPGRAGREQGGMSAWHHPGPA
ncbi:OPT oligopeptide transporter [Mycena kentingensis (nom. inval.)]|nr:OPT oligopeptide transporter [Mycena kentingensis (nom. inval.)]